MGADNKKRWWPTFKDIENWWAIFLMFIVVAGGLITIGVWIAHADESHEKVATNEQALVAIVGAKEVDEAVLRTLCSLGKFTDALECVRLRLDDNARKAKQ